MGLAAANPAFIAMPPRSTRRAISPPAPTDVARRIDAAEPDLGVFVLVAATTGARRGELCGLRWSDIDLTEPRVEITRAIIIVDGNSQVAPTKTRQTRRIALDPVTVGPCGRIDVAESSGPARWRRAAIRRVRVQP